MPSHPALTRTWAFALAVVLFVGVGVWALRLQAQQARDTIRKHDIEDLEQALLRHRHTAGTFPPADAPVWCGRLSDHAHRAVRDAIEGSLREDEKYTKPEKPFPTDPTFAGTDRDYFYWKTSPVSFELLAELEADPNNSRIIDREGCALVHPEARAAAPGNIGTYDYSIVSAHRSAF